MIEIKITGETAEDIRAQFNDLLGIELAENSGTVVQLNPAETKTPPARSRSAASKKTETAAPAPDASKSNYTLDDIRKLIADSGQPEKARDLLTGYKDVEGQPVTRLTMLQQHDFTPYAASLKLINVETAAPATDNFLD